MPLLGYLELVHAAVGVVRVMSSDPSVEQNAPFGPQLKDDHISRSLKNLKLPATDFSIAQVRGYIESLPSAPRTIN